MSDYGYDDPDPGDYPPDYPDENQDDEKEIELENTYYQNEDMRSTDPENALVGLLRAIELEKELANEGKRGDGLSSYKYTFQALHFVIVLVCDLARAGKAEYIAQHLRASVEAILPFMSAVAPNDANDATLKIIEALIALEDTQASQANIELILQSLRERKSSQLFFQAAIKLAKIYLDQGDEGKLEKQLSELKALFRKPDGTDDQANSDKLIQIYSLEIELLQRKDQLAALRTIHKKVQRLANTGLNDQRVQSIIQDLAGKIFMSERRFAKAEAQLQSAFEGYSNVSSDKARQTLKLLYIASILARSPNNPNRLQESQVYRLDPEVRPLITLREAYDRKDMAAFNSLLNDKLVKDATISQYLTQLKKVSSLEKIQEVVKPYSRVRLQYLAKVLACDLPTIQIYLVEMISEGKIRGRIDAVGGFFENDDMLIDTDEQRQLSAIKKMTYSIQGAINV